MQASDPFSKTCPLCGLISPTSTRLCDCRFSFRGSRMGPRVLYVIAALFAVLAIASTAGAQQRLGSWLVTQSSEDATFFVAANTIAPAAPK